MKKTTNKYTSKIKKDARKKRLAKKKLSTKVILPEKIIKSPNLVPKTETEIPNSYVIRIPTGKHENDPVKTQPIQLRRIVLQERKVPASEIQRYIVLPLTPCQRSKYPRPKSPRKKKRRNHNVIQETPPRAPGAELEIEASHEVRSNAEVDYESCDLDIRACGHVITAMERLDIKTQHNRDKYFARSNILFSVYIINLVYI